MCSKRLKLPIVKEKPKSSLADTTKSKTEKPVRLYQQLQPTIIVLQQPPENIPDHITVVADRPPAIDDQRAPIEASQAQYTLHHTIVSRKNFALHSLQRSRPKSLQEDTQLRTTFMSYKPYTFPPDP